MSTPCRCGAPITWGQTQDGQRLPLEVYSSYAGEGRYLVIDFGTQPWLVTPVTAKAVIAAYPDHRLTCPRE